MRTIWFLLLAASALSAASSTVELALNLSATAGTISPRLFGLNLEWTRHDLFEGLSAQLIANRKFSLQVASPDWPYPQPGGWTSTSVPPRWFSIGGAAVGAQGSGIAGGITTAIQCEIVGDGSPCGVGQTQVGDGYQSWQTYGSAIPLTQNRVYNFRAVLKNDAAQPIAVQVDLVIPNGTSMATLSYAIPGGIASWQTVESNFTSAISSLNATLTLTASSSATARAWIGAVSLMPADNYLGMREDVVQDMVGLDFHGPLRYPGGCYASVAGPWTDGLMEPDQRPTRFTSPDHCPAVPGGVNAYTDGMMVDGVGIDEYIQLCRRIGAEPAITVKLNYGTPDEIETAAAWVEYCNGNTSTLWGAVRASRGYQEPFNVGIWYLGNEIANQRRFPNYPAENRYDLSPTSSEYAAMLAVLIPAMVAKDANLDLIAVGGGHQYPGWDQDYIASTKGALTAVSWHCGYGAQPPPSGWTAEAVTAAAKWPSVGLEVGLADIRSSLNTSGAQIGLSMDEWGLSPWTTNTYSTAHGVYAASFLSVVVGEIGQANSVLMANYFEPINEGAIQVGPFSSVLTPVGEVFGVYANHQGQPRLVLPSLPLSGDPSYDMEVVGSVGARGDVFVTLANRNATAAHSVTVTMAEFPASKLPTVVAVRSLTASSYGIDSQFASSASTVPLVSAGAGASMTVDVPAFSVVQCHVTV